MYIHMDMYSYIHTSMQPCIEISKCPYVQIEIYPCPYVHISIYLSMQSYIRNISWYPYISMPMCSFIHIFMYPYSDLPMHACRHISMHKPMHLWLRMYIEIYVFVIRGFRPPSSPFSPNRSHSNWGVLWPLTELHVVKSMTLFTERNNW